MSDPIQSQTQPAAAAAYYLQPRTLGLPEDLPAMTYLQQADGRQVFHAETPDVLIWVQPKPHAWDKPGVYTTERPAMKPQGTATNFGVNIQGLAAHEGRVETNDPGFVPSFNATAATTTSQQVPLPLGPDGTPTIPPGWILPGALVLALILFVAFRPRR